MSSPYSRIILLPEEEHAWSSHQLHILRSHQQSFLWPSWAMIVATPYFRPLVPCMHTWLMIPSCYLKTKSISSQINVILNSNHILHKINMFLSRKIWLTSWTIKLNYINSGQTNSMSLISMFLFRQPNRCGLTQFKFITWPCLSFVSP